MANDLNPGDVGSSGAEDAGGSTLGGQAAGNSDSNLGGLPVSGGEAGGLVVGNQRFKDVEDLKRAYAESQKGYTQATQKHSREIGAYKWISEKLKEAEQRDPEGLRQWVSWLQGKPRAQQEKILKGMQEQAPEQDNSELEAVKDRLDRQEVLSERNEFISSHPDLSAQEVNQVIQQVIDWDDEGKERSLEEAYRYLSFDKLSGKLAQSAEKKATESVTKGKQSTVLGASASSAQGRAKANPFPWKGSENEKNAAILAKLKELGYTED